MDRLADEILQLVFNELDDPLPFASVSRRCRAFYRDPYVRAGYLLTRSGHSQALYVALGRPDFTTERVIDILLTSGAHLSRYLVQLAAHHYFRTPVPFIKHPWVKSLPFPLFAHFLRRATERLGDFSTSRGEDDGALFCTFVKESRLAPASRTVSPEHIEEMLARYKFMPFCDKDPIMAQFPLALAVEPRFLPLAVANGFRMDSCYRDYVFRRMFERSAAPDAHARKTLHNVRELCRLDPSMFVSRTVAAEVCMEAQANAPAYSALKSLDRAHELKFELSTLVHDLIHNFASTRSITIEACAGAIQFLYRDLFPLSSSVALATSPSSIARVALRPVLLLSVFASAPSATAAHTALGTLGLVPLDGVDLRMLLRSPFIESFGVVGSYASVFMAWGAIEVKEMLEEVAVECLGISSKGGMLKAIVKRYPEVADSLARAIRGVHSLSLDMLPRAEDERACAHYTTSLCGDLCAVRKTCTAVPRRAAKSATVDGKHDAGESGDRACEGVAEVQEEIRNEGNECNVLGRIGQLTLTAAINHDELTTARRRRYHLVQYPDFASLLPYPADAVHTARFLALHFGARHRVTAELMKHVMLNQPAQVCTHYVAQLRVPVTMVHFRMLARLGRAPAFVMFSAIEDGAKFYEDEEGYLLEDARAELLAPQRSTHATMDAPEPEPATVAVDPGPSMPSSSRPGRKRPRRSAAATVKSYALPPSSDEDEEMEEAGATSKPAETEMSKWIRHLSVLHRDEIRKVNERKKRTGGRVAKSDFVRFLGPRLREWRRREDERVRALVDGGACGVESEGEGDDGDDGEYRAANVRRPAKRRRT